MEQFRQALRDDEEACRQLSKREPGSIASHGSGEGSQMAAAFNALKVETVGGSSRKQIAPSAIQKPSKRLLPRGVMDKDSLQPIDSMGSSPGRNQSNHAANDIIQSSDVRHVFSLSMSLQ